MNTLSSGGKCIKHSSEFPAERGSHKQPQPFSGAFLTNDERSGVEEGAVEQAVLREQRVRLVGPDRGGARGLCQARGDGADRSRRVWSRRRRQRDERACRSLRVTPACEKERARAELALRVRRRCWTRRWPLSQPGSRCAASACCSHPRGCSRRSNPDTALFSSRFQVITSGSLDGITASDVGPLKDVFGNVFTGQVVFPPSLAQYGGGGMPTSGGGGGGGVSMGGGGDM